MPRGFDPSEALATLAGAVHRWVEDGRPVPAWVTAGEAVLLAAPPPAAPAPSLGVGALGRLVRPALRLADPRVIPNEARFIEVMKALQLLDDWHEPLNGGPTLAGVSPDHETAWRRFLMLGRFNDDLAHGYVVPGQCIEGPAAGSGHASVAPNLLLEATCFLPVDLPAGHPDGVELKAPGRRVKVCYRPPSLLACDLRPLAGPQPVVGIAPVLQQETDARVVTFDDPGRYGIEILAGRDRLADVVRKAMADQVELLFMPEMTVSEECLGDFASIVRRSASEHRRSAGSLPGLRYIVAGCVSPPSAATPGRNYIIVMNLAGQVVLKQHKLTRWNLQGHHQYFYGLRRDRDDAAPEVLEDIEPGDEIWIADLEGLGRFATLICADMGYEQPGDRIVRAVGVDWLHAPIMDRSIDWEPDGRGGFRPWVVDSAVKAARQGASRVIVTNSMLFSHLTNHVRVAGSAWPPFDECGVGFLLHRDDVDLHFAEAKVSMGETATLLAARAWQQGFVTFPPP